MSEATHSVKQWITEYIRDAIRGWDTFWFRPADPATLCLIRICAGAMLLYTHLIWSLDLVGFFGKAGRISPQFATEFATPSGFAWSYLSGVESSTVLWILHIVALVVLFLFMVGWQTRIVSVLALIITISYVHRGSGTMFGLDQINVILALYLTLGPCGARYSVDAWLRKKRTGSTDEVAPSTWANIAIRLLQTHLCVIYLFAGMGKLLGASWWEGTALWNSLANYEYQSINMLWLAHFPWLINLLTHVALAWEISYAFLIWPKSTRPLVLALAIPIHLGIAMCLGMVTFGVVMLIANLAFISPLLIRRVFGGEQA